MPRGEPYSDFEKTIIHQMKENNKSPMETAQALRQQGYKRSNRNISDYLYSHAKKVPRVKQEVKPEFDKALEQIEEQRAIIPDLMRDHYINIGRNVEKKVKVLVLTDLHVPYELDDVIQHAITNHGDADVLVLGGDVLENHSVSCFKKNKIIPFRNEYQAAMEYIKLFAGMFKRVVLVSGNHERRLQNYVTDRVGNMLKGLIYDDPMAMLANGMDFGENGMLEKKYNLPNVTYEPSPRGDYIKIGKLIVAHHNNYSTVPMRTAISVAEAYLGFEDYQCIILGHTHAMGQLIWKNKLLIESGCCCMPLEYVFNKGRLAKGIQTFGYSVAYLDDEGNVDFNSTRAIYCGVGRIPKKDAYEMTELTGGQQ